MIIRSRKMNQIPCSSLAGIGVMKVFIPYRTIQITPARMMAPIRSQSNEIAIPAISLALSFQAGPDLALGGEVLQLLLGHPGLRFLARPLAGQLGPHELALLFALCWHTIS